MDRQIVREIERERGRELEKKRERSARDGYVD